jgi:hypothetical protein
MERDDAMNGSYGQSWYKVYGYAGKTVTWCPSDSEERFDAHMADPKKRALLEKYGWTRDNVSYTFNKDGFRSEEFTGGVNDSVVFLGCSLTAGIGVDLESSWAYKVASSLGLRRYNLGVGASSSDTCFRLAYHWIPKLRPKYVVMLTPMATRMEVVLDKDIINIIPNMKWLPEFITAKITDFYNGWLSNPANAEMNQLKNVMGIRTICNGIGVPLIEIPMESASGVLTTSHADGRDLMHPGRGWNEAVANRFLDKIGA